MGFAPAWLRQVSSPASHDHFNHCPKPKPNHNHNLNPNSDPDPDPMSIHFGQMERNKQCVKCIIKRYLLSL